MRLGRIPPFYVLAGAWLLVIAYAFPGQITQDSLDHLSESRSGLYTDAHPPAINLLWTVLDYVVAGPFLMLVLQTTLFVAGLYLLLRRVLAPHAAAWTAAAVYLFPPVMLPFAVIWKDCLMAGGLALGAAALLSERRGVRLAGLAALLLASAVRYNAAAGTFALIVLLFEWRPGLVWWKRYAIGVVTWLVVTGAAIGINTALTDRQMHYWQSSIALHDIAGTLHYLDEDLTDAQVTELLAGTELLITDRLHERIRAKYQPQQFAEILVGEDPLWKVPMGGTVPMPEPRRDAITRAWSAVVFGHPGAYLRHRVAVMIKVLEIGTSRHGAGVVPRRELRFPDAAKQLGLPTGASPLQFTLSRLAGWFVQHVPVFAPWMYLVLALFLLGVNRQRDVLALLLSGVGLESSYLVLAPSTDYRYSHWMVVTVIVSAILVGVRRSSAKFAPSVERVS